MARTCGNCKYFDHEKVTRTKTGRVPRDSSVRCLWKLPIVSVPKSWPTYISPPWGTAMSFVRVDDDATSCATWEERGQG